MENGKWIMCVCIGCCVRVCVCVRTSMWMARCWWQTDLRRCIRWYVRCFSNEEYRRVVTLLRVRVCVKHSFHKYMSIFRPSSGISFTTCGNVLPNFESTSIPLDPSILLFFSFVVLPQLIRFAFFFSVLLSFRYLAHRSSFTYINVCCVFFMPNKFSSGVPYCL